MFRTPCNIIVGGPSGSGKSYFTKGCLDAARELFVPPPPVKHYCYGAWQPLFETMKDVSFHEGLPTVEDLDKWFGPTKGGLLVVDDLMEESGNSKSILDLFTKYSHHRGITLMYLCQDLFPPGKHAKTMSRNAHYMVVFKNPRDQVGIRTLMIQAFPTYWREALQTFEQATSRPFGYLMIDLHPASNDNHRLFSHLLDRQGYTRLYEKEDDRERP